MSRVLFVHQRPHTVHKGFAESIEADFFFYRDYRDIPSDARALFEAINKGLKLPKYDVYLCEGGTTVLPVFFRKLIHRKAKIILLIADETFFRITLGMPFPSSFWGKLQWKVISKYIDGAIAVSEFAKEEAKKVLSCPIKIAYPFIQNKIYNELKSISPDLESYNILSIGYGHPKNGFETLIDAFKIVKKRFPAANLCIVGEGNPTEWNRTGGVHVTGFVPNILPYFEHSSLFCLIGKGQAFPVATLEALCAGLPAIVSKYTGTKEVVRRLRDDFVTDADSKAVADAIIRYFSLDFEEKVELSKSAKRLAEQFNSDKRIKAFKKVFRELLHEVKAI